MQAVRPASQSNRPRFARPSPQPRRLAVPETLQALTDFYWEYVRTLRSPPNEPLAIVITNFQRPELLRRALASAVATELPIVVSCAGVTTEVLAVLSQARQARPDIRVVAQVGDPGCNEMWLRGLQAAQTPYVQILHDDDLLAPGFRAAYQEFIKPNLGRVQYAIWNAQHFDGDNLGRSFKHMPGGTSVYPTGPLRQRFGQLHTLAVSPVAQLLQRELAIRTLHECGQQFTAPSFFTRPGMMVGNDLLLGLRHAHAFDSVLYVDQPLTYYGKWAGSETERMQAAGQTRALAACYDATRHYFVSHPVCPVPAMLQAAGRNRLYVQYYHDAQPARQVELDLCLLYNLINTQLDEIVVVGDTALPVQFADRLSRVSLTELPQPGHHSGRPTFSQLFRLAQSVGPDDISIFCNSDIYFDEDLALANQLPPDTCYALGRWDVQLDGLSRRWDVNNGQDAWFFRGPPRAIPADFPMGYPGCDNRVAYEARQAGYSVQNPACDLRAYHLHLSNVRNWPASHTAKVCADRVPMPYLHVGQTHFGQAAPLAVLTGVGRRARRRRKV